MTILGVSRDTIAAQATFAREVGAGFPLLADPRGAVIRLYGVGLVLGIARRVTFLIDTAGRIARVYKDVVPATHAAEVRKDLERVT